MNKVLIIGSGGREHALAWKFAQSPAVEKVYAAPGNAGIGEVAECVDIAVSDFTALAEFAKNENITLTFVGPDAPLGDGIVDYFENENLLIFGPRKNAAMIESSKSFAKDLMKKYKIPTAGYEVFTDFASAAEHIKRKKPPYVIKADGLAAGKGVIITATREEAYSALAEMLQNKIFGAAGSTVVIEEFLTGIEFSYFAFVNGENVYPMVIAKDHKRAFDGDKGPNTGGMGAYSPVPQIIDEVIESAWTEIILPVTQAMVKESRPFTGILYGGLISTKTGVKVIEFNARFGDPETQVILPRMENDIFQVVTDVLNGKDPELKWNEDNVIGVILASKGYPEQYETGFPITGLDKLDEETLLFHSGTEKTENGFSTNGGRVLMAVRKGETLEVARKELYKEIKKVKCTNLFYRKDI